LLHQAGIVEHDVDASEALDGDIDQGLDLRAIGDVGSLGERLGAATVDLVRQRLDTFAAARPEHDDRAAGREIARRRRAESAAGAGYDGNFAFCRVAHNNTPACHTPRSGSYPGFFEERVGLGGDLGLKDLLDPIDWKARLRSQPKRTPRDASATNLMRSG
jgi:hypothetical protein